MSGSRVIAEVMAHLGNEAEDREREEQERRANRRALAGRVYRAE